MRCTPAFVPPLFPRWTNTVYRVALILGAAGIVTAIAAPMIYIRTPYASSEHDPIAQPVEFDHRHHKRDDGIDCIYCHTGAEREASAGIPATDVCMGCHGQIWNESVQLEPVRKSYETGTSIAWRRVHDLPDFVYFHHGVHVSNGIDCVRCHGEVDRMARVYRVVNLTMGWCLDCHREGRELTSLTTCSACHR
jgi:hypothetical protein